MTLNGGTLVTTATFSSARNVTLGGGAISPSAATTLTLSGALSGSGGLTMNGAGTLILSAGSGQNTFTGGVTVTTGTLQVSGDGQPGQRGEHRDAQRRDTVDAREPHHGAGDLALGRRDDRVP